MSQTDLNPCKTSSIDSTNNSSTMAKCQCYHMYLSIPSLPENCPISGQCALALLFQSTMLTESSLPPQDRLIVTSQNRFSLRKLTSNVIRRFRTSHYDVHRI